MLHADICIAGAGIIGLSLALELRARHLSVIVVEAGDPLRQASTAAAGMLAAEDPHNPVELSELSRLSISLYPAFLERLQSLTGTTVPFQTSHILQWPNDPSTNGDALSPILGFDSLLTEHGLGLPSPSGFNLLDEHSLDPRQLAATLLAAIEAASVRLISQCRVTSTTFSLNSVLISTSHGTLEAAHFIDCTGAWANDTAFRVQPIKGQMLAVELPASFPLKMTLRTSEIYIVPRTIGPNAGRAIIGATVEDAGFDKTVHVRQIEELRQQAIALLPQLASSNVLESWAGLRPAAPDRLPLLGAHPSLARHWVATGHYRNGILLAPATARVMAEMLLGEAPEASLHEFEPGRLSLLKPSSR